MTYQNAASRPLLIDFGSETTKAGFAGQSMPALIFESTVGRPKYKKVLGSQSVDEVIGPAPNVRTLYTITRAVVRGELNAAFHGRLLQKIWSELSVEDSAAQVFVAEPPFATLSSKLALAQTLLEERKARALFFGTQAILSLFGYGRTDGFVLESGEGVTQLAPVFNGYRLAHAVEKVKFGGEDLTSYFGSLLQRSGALADGADRFLCDEMKKALVEALPSAAELEGLLAAKDARRKGDYELPDGEVVAVRSECFEAAELLFRPEADGLHVPSLQELAVGCIRRLDVDLRRYMYRNVHLSGGTTMTVGFPERLSAEMSRLVHERTALSVIAPGVDKTLLAWQGASALCQLSSFAPQWISAAELAEKGERIFLEKSL